jgi:hypothetical protein
MFEVGTRVYANYGAMFPISEGEVVKVNSDDTYTVMFDDGAVRTVTEIREKGYRSVNGSPIGVFAGEYA